MAFRKTLPRPVAAVPAAPPRGRRFLPRLRLWQWLGALGLLAGIAVATFYALWSLQFDISTLGDMPQLAEVYDQDGNLYSRLRGENRIIVPLDRVSPHFVDALVAREDSRFYSHHGVDPRGIARAIVRNLLRGRRAEGASTITQQLARNSLPLGGKTFHRKMIEAFVALRIEHRYPKAQILEFYINRIYYGNRLYGLETASQAYFGKPAKDLTLSESALMAGLIRSPGRFSPVKNPEGAARERNTVLERMTQLGKITPEQADRARREKVIKARLRPLGFQDNYAMDAISRELKDLLDDDDLLADGNLRIYTTLDPQLEKAATDAIETHLSRIENSPGYTHPRKRDYHPRPDAEKAEAPAYLQGALVVVDNRTGGIRALVGGRDFSQSNFNRALLARRQVGSSFKPFVYATAFGKGLFPGANLSDGPMQPGEVKDATGRPVNWTPGNSDGTFGGVQPAEVGLIRSRNTMSVRVGTLADFDREGRFVGDVAKTAAAAGLGDVPESPTTYLGAFECDLKTLTDAYTVFPNGGERRPAYFIERVDAADGAVLYQAAHDNGSRALPPGVAWMTSTVLEKVFKNGTAAEARGLGWTRPAGGKTGTTNDFHDAWFFGYTTALTCGVWVGLDRPETITPKGYGAALALPIWVQTMNKADARRYPAEAFKSPEDHEVVSLCRFSNELATDGCAAAGLAYRQDVPVSLRPKNKDGSPAYCFAHQGAPEVPGGELIPGQPPPAGRPTPPPARGEGFPNRMFRSFRRLFGG